MIDISAVGAKVTFHPNTGVAFTVSEFSDEGTPFEASDVDLSTNAKNLNGEMISSRTPSVIPFAITVIPNSVSDHKLRSLAQKSLIQPGNNQASSVVYFTSVQVVFPANFTTDSGDAAGGKTEVTYHNVRFKSAPLGPSTSSEGRMAARTYSFEAESAS